MDELTSEVSASAKTTETSRIRRATQVDDFTPPLSTAKQRQTILSHLQSGNRLTTFHARERLGIPHPAGRVQELRDAGESIVTHWVTETDITGRKHRIAQYILMNG